MAAPEHPALGRRAALLGVLGGGVVILTGCESRTPAATPSGSPNDLGTPSPTVPPTGSASSSASSSAGVLPETADRLRVGRALASTEALLAGLVALRRPDGTAALAAMHTAHRTVLLDLLGTPGSPLPAAPLPALHRAEVPLREAGLQAELVSAALTAEDGLVARLLASMSAGIAQHLMTLPPSTPPRGNPSADPSPSASTA
jgi:hypothetical protein